MKDSNAQSYFQWCNAADFASLTPDLRWNGAIHALQLSSVLARPPEGVPPASTRAAAATPPLAVDPFETWARANAAGTAIAVGGVTAPALPLFEAAPGETIADLAHTAEGWLLIALRSGDEGRVVVRDLSDRFDEISLAEPGFAADRITVGPRIWLVDRGRRALRCLDGAPLPRRIERRRRDPADFQGRPLNSDPLRLRRPPADASGLTEEILDAEADAAGRLILLVAGPERSAGLVVADMESVGPPRFIEGLRSAFSLARLGPGKLAFLVPGAAFAVASGLPDDSDGPLAPLGDRLPLKGWTGGRFCKSTDHVPRYPVSADPEDLRPFRRLIALSKPEYARAGRARAAILDGGAPGMTWHRLYAEAQIPPECGFTAFLAAGDDPAALDALPQAALHPHLFGGGPAAPGAPRAVWLDMDTELPFRTSATGGARKPDRCGLFSVLVQTAPGDTPIRRLRGRYLRVELALAGPGRATPRLHALRVWGARNAWRDRYLPAYLGVESGPDAAGSDFLDRYLALFESYLTPLEDLVAQGWRLTNPATAPADALDWLAGWLGAPLDSGLDLPRRRRFLAEAMSVWRSRGTLLGLHKVLDIVTGGGVVRGEVVVLEHYLMRRTFSTILGADLSDDNPLTPYAASSGNSHLGPTFFLGQEDHRAFLALFRPGLLSDPLTGVAEREQAAAEIATLFDAAAHRASVIVRSATDEATLGLIARAVEREAPAHVAVDVRRAPASLVLGLSSLVAVETRIGPRPPDPPFALDAASLGGAFLSDAPSLDPRLEGGA